MQEDFDDEFEEDYKSEIQDEGSKNAGRLNSYYRKAQEHDNGASFSPLKKSDKKHTPAGNDRDKTELEDQIVLETSNNDESAS